MAGGRTFKVVFTGDTSEVEAKLGKLGGTIAGVEGPTSKFGAALSNVGSIAGGFVLGQGILKAPDFLMDAARAAAEDEQSNARLQQTIRSLGGDFDAQIAAVDRAIDSAQKLAFSDDDVRDSFQFLAQATGSSEEALKRQQVAMDLARGAHIPLSQATKMLGKMNAENVDTFKKLGIEMADNATEADALAAVQAKFGGQAQAYAKSTAGQFEQMQIKMAEAKETIGYALLPVMAGLATILAEYVVPAIEAVAQAAGPTFAVLGTVAGTAFDGIRVAFEALAPYWVPIAAGIAAVAAVIIGSMVPAAIAWTAAEWAKVAAMLASAAAFVEANAPLILIAAAVGVLVAAVVLLVQHWDTVTQKVPALGVAFDAVKAVIQAFAGWITGTFVPAVQSIATTVTTVVTTVVGFVQDNWGKIQAVIEPQMEAVRVIVETVWAQIQTVFETVIGVIEGIIDVFVGVFTGDWDRAKDGVLGIVGALKDGVIDSLTNMIRGIAGLAGIMLDAGMDLGKGMVEGLVNGLGTIIGKVMDIAGVITDAVKGAVNSALRWLHDNVRIHITMPNEIPNIDWGFPLIQLAKGVRNFVGGMALVGEQGPELVTLPRGANVWPADKTKSMIRNLSGVGPDIPLEGAGAIGAVGLAGGGELQVHIHGNVYARDEGEARRAAADMGYLLRERLRAMGAA